MVTIGGNMRFSSILITFIVLLTLSFFASINATAKLFLHDDFEKDTIGNEPKKWEIGFDGETKAEVVADPKDASNKVLKPRTIRPMHLGTM